VGKLENEAYTLLDSILVSKASDLALKGRYGEAEGLLNPLTHTSEPSTEALDLLAKIYAQQGMILEARNAWKIALQFDPNNQDYVKAIAKCERVVVPDFKWSKLFYLVFLLLIIIITSLIFIIK
jgi:tetratricopeptide (TPR) repeat protein